MYNFQEKKNDTKPGVLQLQSDSARDDAANRIEPNSAKNKAKDKFILSLFSKNSSVRSSFFSYDYSKDCS